MIPVMQNVPSRQNTETESSLVVAGMRKRKQLPLTAKGCEISLWDNGNVLDNIVVTQYMNIQKYSLICIILNDDFSYMNFISKIF